jgi:hypothetical protein
MLLAIGFSIVYSGCGSGEPTEAELEAIAEGTRRAVADKLEADLGDLGASAENSEPSKEDLDLREANEIMGRALAMMENAPDGTNRRKWTVAVGNLFAGYDRRKAAEGHVSAARWLKAELLDRPPEEVVERWGMTGSELPETEQGDPAND